MYPRKNELDPAWFTGGCLTMAKALKHVLGRGARLVDVVEPESSALFLYQGRPHHVVVEQDGLFWDAAGPHTSDEILSFWGSQARSPLKLEKHHPARAKDQGLKVKPHLQAIAASVAKRVVEGRV